MVCLKSGVVNLRRVLQALHQTHPLRLVQGRPLHQTPKAREVKQKRRRRVPGVAHNPVLVLKKVWLHMSLNFRIHAYWSCWLMKSWTPITCCSRLQHNLALLFNVCFPEMLPSKVGLRDVPKVDAGRSLQRLLLFLQVSLATMFAHSRISATNY